MPKDFPVLFIMGPTASGKTGLSLRLAQEKNAAIVNADSLLVYQGLDIGTAKPTVDEVRIVKHYLLDCCEPGEEFTLAQFLKLSRPILLERFQGNEPTIIVGGTGLYARALAEGYVVPPVAPDLEQRAILEQWSLSQLQQRLLASEAEAEKYVDLKNPRRIIRAIELVAAGYRLPEVMGCRNKPPYRVVKVILDLEPEYHKDLIKRRVEGMVSSGWLEECRHLLSLGQREAVEATKAIGYKEAFEHLEGSLSLAEFKEQVFVQTCQLAKRQRTWFRREKNAIWFTRGREEIEQNNDREAYFSIREILKSSTD